jgi:membrane dipeptidase
MYTSAVIMKSGLATVLVVLVFGVFSMVTIKGAAGAAQRQVTDAEVQRVHRSAIVIDTHADTPSRTVTGWDIGPRSPDGHVDVPRMKEGGLGAEFFAAYVAASYAKSGQAARRALEMIDSIRYDIVGRYPDVFELALTAGDIERIHRSGKIAALIGVEGGHAIEDSPRLLRDFYALGARYMTLTHANTNNWADSSGDIEDPSVPHHNGLTGLGRQVIAEMNRLGMMVDISHVSDKTFWDALEASRAPVFASHSSCRAISNVPRNMTDEMIQAMAKKGGVIQINLAPDFLSQKVAEAAAARRERIRQLQAQYKDQPEKLSAERQRMEKEAIATLPRATLDDVVAHIDHAVKLAGVDHVGIGSDFDGIGATPVGFDDVSKFPNLTRALLERGYSEKDIRKILGGNMLRFMRQVEQVSAEMKRP